MDVFGIRERLIAGYSSYVRSFINIREPGVRGHVERNLDGILDTFPIVRRTDESRWGEYRNRRVILDIYEAMAEAQRSGQSYATRLDPPPASPLIAHPPRSVEGETP
jgi:hypothetical protein